MKNSLRLFRTFQVLCTTLFVLSISLDATAQHSKSAIEQQLVTSVAPTPEYSTWFLLAAGTLGVVVARKRI